MSARRESAATPRALPLLLLALATACSAVPPSTSRAPPRDDAPSDTRATTLGPARWALFDHLGTRFDEAGRGATTPRPEPVIADGVRMIVDAGMILASARQADRLSGFRSLPERLGGGFVLWSEDRVYLAKDFLGELSPIADIGAIGGARPWLSSILLRTPAGLLELHPRAPGSLHRATLPGVSEALALDARRAVRLDALGRASFTLDGGASWTDVLATRGVRVRALAEGAGDEIVLTAEGSRDLVLGTEGSLHPAPDPPTTSSALGEARAADPPLPRLASSRALPDDILPQAVGYGALLPGSRIVVAREHGVRVLASATGLPIGDADLASVDERFAHCQAVPLGSPPAGLTCVADSGATLLDLDGPLSRPELEATFPPGGGFFGGPRGRLAYDGGCGPEPPASTDLGPGTTTRVDSPDEGSSVPVPAPAPEPAPPPAPEPDDARVCVRVGRSRWVEHQLRGADARRLYRWVPGDGGAATAIVLTGGELGDGGAEEADAGQTPGVTTTDDGLRVIRIDPEDAALLGGAFPAVPPPQHDEPNRATDTSFWQDDDGSIRGWIHLPADGEEKVETPPTPQGPAQRPLPVVEALGGRVAGVRIDAAGRVTVLPLPKGVVSVVTGGPFGLAMASVPDDARDGGLAAEPARDVWFETVDGGASWAPIEAPPVGTLETSVDSRDSFACSPIGCALPSGVVRIGWGSKPPEPVADLALTAAASPRIREPSPLPLTCRIDADALPSTASRRPPRAPPPPPPPKPHRSGKRPPPAPSVSRRTAHDRAAPTGPEAPAPIALRLPVQRDVGVQRDQTWTGDVLPPLQPGAPLHHITATFPAPGQAYGSTVPILAAGPRGLVDLMLFREPTQGGLRRRLRAGGGVASFIPFAIHFQPSIGADGPDGSLVFLDATHDDLWVSRGAATFAALHLVSIPDVSRTRLTLAQRLDGGALALAGYSTTTGEIFAGALDLGRAEVGPLVALGRLSELAEAGACPHATHRLLVELPVQLRVSGRHGEVFVEERVTAAALLLAGGGEAVCVEAVETALNQRVLRAVLGAGGSASVWSEGATVRGTCSAKRP